MSSNDRLLVLQDFFIECCEVIDNSIGRIQILSHYGRNINNPAFKPMNKDLKREKYRLIKHKLFGAMALDRIQAEKERIRNEQ